ncbi:hypothetical protein ACC785_06280 [Rhizobium ruizarguesonis]
MKSYSGILRTIVATAALALSFTTAMAGGWGHGPSFSQSHRFVHDTVTQVVVPVVTGVLNAGSAGAARSAQNPGGGEMEKEPGAPQDDHQATTNDKTAPKDDDDAASAGMPAAPSPFWRDPWLQSLKDRTEMPIEPEGPTIGPAKDPIGPPSCGMRCPAVIDGPHADLPDPREEKSPEPPPVAQPILD